MIDASILAAIETRLQRALALPPRRYRPVVIGGLPLGLVDDARAARLARSGAFRIDEEAVTLDPGCNATCAARSATLARVAGELRAEGALPAWREERYAVAVAWGEPPCCHIERGAARYFGFRTWAAHLNGTTSRAGTTAMWLARRSAQKAVDPGLLDNLVGGGIAAGFSVAQTLAKEAWEEAGIGAALARAARPAGTLRVRRAMVDGLQRETIYVHDLDLPADFMPANQDGEVSEYRLADIDEAARLIAVSAGADEVTVEASLVVVDYLIRHGAITAAMRERAALETLCRGAT